MDTESCVEEKVESEETVEKKVPGQENFDKMKATVEASGSPEEKISHILMFMEEALAHGNAPSFKFFWEGRKMAMDLFKEENLPFAVRSHLWNKYVELTKEAHRLKEVLDEQSKFAAEQIELAIQSLESEIEGLDAIIADGTPVAFDPQSKFLSDQESKYLDKQKELNVLNAFAARINALRKELIKTEMRIRFKNKFFQSLSAAGDKIFPRRKDLIKQLSKEFIEDVNAIIAEHFSAEEPNQPVFVLRDEIKALQGIAKVLTLNTQAFNNTRKSLSDCWDKIKKIEKERKKERAKVKGEFKENADLVEVKLKEVEEGYEGQTLDQNATLAALEEVSKFMRTVQLDRDDVKHFRGRMQKIRGAIQDILDAEEKEKRERARQAELERKEKVDAVTTEFKALLESGKEKGMEHLQQEQERLVGEFQNLNTKKPEVAEFDRLQRSLNDLLAHMRIENLPADDKAALQELQLLLGESKKRRKEIRDQLEECRRASGASGLDLEQAFKQQELEKHEKERLAQVEEEIRDIESRISKLSK